METYMVVASMLLRSGKTKGVRIYSTARELFPLVGPSRRLGRDVPRVRLRGRPQHNQSLAALIVTDSTKISRKLWVTGQRRNSAAGNRLKVGTLDLQRYGLSLDGLADIARIAEIRRLARASLPKRK
jgi:hypothetical protein